jgi:hypothetical protein
MTGFSTEKGRRITLIHTIQLYTYHSYHLSAKTATTRTDTLEIKVLFLKYTLVKEVSKTRELDR